MPSKEEKDKFSMKIMSFAQTANITHMEAVIEFCENNEMEPEVAAQLVNETLKNIIQVEASKVNYLPKMNTLPI